MHVLAFINQDEKQFKENIKCKINFPAIANITKYVAENKDRYIHYRNNQHHWTTTYCWNKVIPDICSKFNFRLNSKDFSKITYIWNKCDFSYHEKQICNDVFRIENYDNKTKYSGEHTILRNMNNCPYLKFSLYHSLFSLAHFSGRITNLTTTSTIRLAINCDSMSIPIIPILVYFCKDLIIFDKRTDVSQNNMQKLIDFNPTHYLGLFLDINFLRNNKYISNLK